MHKKQQSKQQIDVPFKLFWVVDIACDGDVSKYKSVLDTPVIWVFTKVNAKIKQQKEHAKELKKRKKSGNFKSRH